MTVDKIDVADLIELLPGRPRLLALGEPTHGENVLLDLRNEIFRQLVEREQYRTIAIESDCLMGLVVDDYVTTGVGRLDEVMECGFSHEFGAMAGNRELVRWMRAYNDGRPSADQVRFVGFDGPLEITGGASPRQALTALHDYLFPASGAAFGDLLGADEQWLEPAAMRDPARSVGRTPEAERLRLIVDELVDLLTTEAPRLIATTSRAEWERARLYGRTAAGLLRYHFWMADASPDRLARVHRLARVLSARASMMAANLLAVDGPALVFAHNAHLQRDKSSMRL
ncbi:MAG: erythromycin esterase family protein, partial [Actinoplanes sp.]